jgi:hypothetical protein
MRQRGRQSTEAKVLHLPVTNERPQLIPSRPLTKEEKRIFDLILRDHRHLRSFDAPLLTAYAVACARMLSTRDSDTFDKMTRLAISLATRLRLTPQSGMQSVQLGRRYADTPRKRNPWDRHDPDDDKQ